MLKAGWAKGMGLVIMMGRMGRMGTMGMMGIVMGIRKEGSRKRTSRSPCHKEGGDLLSRIALQYHRRGQA